MKKTDHFLRPSLLVIAWSMLFPVYLLAQKTSLADCRVTATGTGKTTGEVVKLSIDNPTAFDVTDKIGPLVVPSDGKYQEYIVPKLKNVVIAAKSSIQVFLYGYCTDIRKPPPGYTDTLPQYFTWTLVVSELTTPFMVTSTVLHPDNNPSAAPFLLHSINAISDAFDQLRADGKISTPFSANPEKEREAVIQQTYWIVMASKRGNPYTRDEFRERTYTQFETNSGTSPAALPPEQKKQLDKGVDDFWKTFEAVGTQAKVLTTPVSQPVNEIPPTGVNNKTCGCGESKPIDGLGIKIYLSKESIDTYEADSIPWNNNSVYIGRPEFLCTCKPMECLPDKNFEQKITITYKDKRFASPPSAWKPYDFIMRSPVMEHQGEMLIEFRYKCHCKEQLCDERTLSRKLVFMERNKCCDRIREKQNGDLKFAVANGSASISGNSLSFNIPGCDVPPVVFDFNLEAFFCNLSENQIFSKLVQLMQTAQTGGKISELYSSRNLQMAGPSDDKNMSRYYGFSFATRKNEKEFAIFFSVDETRCVFDISVFCNGEMQEFTAPPYISPDELRSMANGLSNPGNPQTWMQAMMILSHLSRAQQYNRTLLYQNAFQAYLQRVLQLVNQLANSTQDKSLKDQLDAVRTAATDALKANDFKKLGPVLEKMLPVANTLYNK